MKHMLHSFEKQEDSSAISRDIGLVKEVVTAVKQASIMLPPGYYLVQKCETHFGTTNDVIQRFLKSAHLVRDINNEKIQRCIQQMMVLNVKDAPVYPALNTIVPWFAPIRHVQTAMKASDKESTPVAITMFYLVLEQLGKLSAGIPTLSLEIYHLLTQLLAKDCVSELLQIKVHDIWIAGAVLHPGYRNLCIVRETKLSADLCEKGLRFIRNLMCRRQDAAAPVGHTTSILSSVVFGEQFVHVEDMMAFSGSQETVEIALYKCERISESTIAE